MGTTLTRSQRRWGGIAVASSLAIIAIIATVAESRRRAHGAYLDESFQLFGWHGLEAARHELEGWERARFERVIGAARCRLEEDSGRPIDDPRSPVKTSVVRDEPRGEWRVYFRWDPEFLEGCHSLTCVTVDSNFQVRDVGIISL